MDKAPFHSTIAEGPDNSSAYWIHASDGVRLRAGLLKSEKATKGTIFLLPGRSEYIENYGRIGAEFSAFGFTTFAIDWRGQGLSDRLAKDTMVGHVTRFSDYQNDMVAMFNGAEELDLPKPWYLVGHSMGACIGLRAIMEGAPVVACGFTSPMWGIKMSALERVAAWPLSLLARTIGKGSVYVPGVKRETYVLSSQFDGNKMTHDPDMYRYWVKQAQSVPELTTAGPSMGWLFEALKECRQLSKMGSPDIPCIAFCADNDHDVDISAIQARMEKWPRGNSELIKNSKHELFLEIPEIRESIVTKLSVLFTES